VCRLLGTNATALCRYEPSAEITVLAHRGLDVARTPAGSRVSHEGESVTATVRRTARPARMEHHEGAPGAVAELARTTGLRVSVGAPIVVDCRLWGIGTASWKGEESPPADTEARMVRFAQLLDTAIANADSRDQHTASRARLLTAGYEARRRVVRDLHDGAQQRLVHTIVTLKLARRALQQNDGAAESLVARLELPVQAHVPAERYPAEIEASAYFVVAEALMNVVKHAQAGRAEVRASVEDGMLSVAVRDDGIGGADPDGHGAGGDGRQGDSAWRAARDRESGRRRHAVDRHAAAVSGPVGAPPRPLGTLPWNYGVAMRIRVLRASLARSPLGSPPAAPSMATAAPVPHCRASATLRPAVRLRPVAAPALALCGNRRCERETPMD